MKRPALQIIQSLSGIAASFSALALLTLTGWAISGPRISYSGVDDSGGVWMACGSLYSDPKWPLYFLPLFGLPALFMMAAIYVFRYCSRHLDRTLGQPDHRVDPKNEETDIH
jgi:hypothetical protein